MSRRKSKLSTFSIFQWFLNSIAIVLGIVPPPRRNRRTGTKRCNNILLQNKSLKTQTRQKCSQIKEIANTNFRIDINSDNICESSKIPTLNNNNNNNGRRLNNLAYGDMNMTELPNVDQRRILCIQVENERILEYIQSLLITETSMVKNTRILDFHELVKSIQSTPINIPHEDASTMTTIVQSCCCEITSCASLVTQSENVRRLKALEFIRAFIEMSKEDFCKYLINEEHLCQQKTLLIYQMIKQFLRIVYQSESEQK